MRWPWTLSLVVMAATAVPAEAFYWYDWPAGTPRDRSVIRPGPHNERNPPNKPPIGPVPLDVPPTGPGPNAVPEPTSIVGILTGLGALIAGRARRRRES